MLLIIISTMLLSVFVCTRIHTSSMVLVCNAVIEYGVVLAEYYMYTATHTQIFCIHIHFIIILPLLPHGTHTVSRCLAATRACSDNLICIRNATPNSLIAWYYRFVVKFAHACACVEQPACPCPCMQIALLRPAPRAYFSFPIGL